MADHISRRDSSFGEGDDDDAIFRSQFVVYDF